jgi:hypothetical protein
LCAHILIDKVSPSDVFQQFLKARAVAVQKALAISSNNSESIEEKLRNVVEIICSTLYHVKAIFYEGPLIGTTSSQEPLLSALLKPILIPDRYTQTNHTNFFSSAQSKESATDDSRLAVDPALVKQALAPLLVEDIHEACCAWIKNVSAVMKQDGKQLLQHIRTAKDLKGIEEAVWNAIYEVIKPHNLPVNNVQNTLPRTASNLEASISRLGLNSSFDILPPDSPAVQRTQSKQEISVNEKGEREVNVPWSEVRCATVSH